MAIITEKQIETTYSLAKDVYAGKLDRAEAIKKLHAEFDMNEASAGDYIDALSKMLRGVVYQRTINMEATKYYLDKISEDFGTEALAQAVSSVEKHVDYYDSLGGAKKVKNRALLEEYRKTIEGTGMLKDLNLLGNACAARYNKEYVWQELVLPEEFKQLFSDRYEATQMEEDSDDTEENAGLSSSDRTRKIKFATHTCRTVTSKDLTIDFPNQWFEIASYFVDYMVEGMKYQQIAHQIYTDIGLPLSKRKDFFEALRDTGPDWQKELERHYTKAATGFIMALGKKLPDAKDREMFIKCISQKDWSHSRKNIHRGDYCHAAVLKLMKVVNVSQAHIAEIVYILSQTPQLVPLLKQAIAEAGNVSADQPMSARPIVNGGAGVNLIVYGAPGSGKSYFVDKWATGSNVFRTIFHPEYQNSDFIGGLRPSRENDGNISYAFVPGPFTNALLQAARSPETSVYLVVEEINRANAAAVFGEIFQLLDRKDGGSEYFINPDETWKAYLGKNGYATPAEVRIPSNLHILATMNSSDQGVFQLDTAFRRRWQFHYCKIDFTQHATKPSFKDPIVPYKGAVYSWTTFASALNETLKAKSVEEDRLVGPFFLTDEERKDKDTCKVSVAGKLLIYLWDDVLRHDRKSLFVPGIKTFSDLVTSYDKGEAIFQSAMEERLPSTSDQTKRAA